MTASPPPALETKTTDTAGTGTPAAGETEVGTATADTTETVPATDTTEVAGTGTATNGTPGIPVTGADVILLECQFCMQGMGNAILVIPDTSTFELVTSATTVSPPGTETGCNTVDTFGGRQVVLCRGEENSTLTLDICANGTDCVQLDVDLQSCPDAGTAQPNATETPGTGTGSPTSTPGTGLGTATPTP